MLLMNYFIYRSADSIPIPRIHHLRPEELSRGETVRKGLVHRPRAESPPGGLRPRQSSSRFATGVPGTVPGRDRVHLQVSDYARTFRTATTEQHFESNQNRNRRTRTRVRARKRERWSDPLPEEQNARGNTLINRDSLTTCHTIMSAVKRAPLSLCGGDPLSLARLIWSVTKAITVCTFHVHATEITVAFACPG